MGVHEEFRLDIDPATNPDVVASITDMGDIGAFRSAYCCHALEHLYPHEVPIALGEFYRVLEPGGSLLLFVPDLEGLTPSDAVLYESPAGPITSWDLFYGMRSAIDSQPHMAHHTGFTAKTLELALLRAGFSRATTRRLIGFNLMALAEKGKP
jgi:SAM-dependent methyltransferase